MFVEESEWIREVLAEIDLPDGAQALDVGCSTTEYRSLRQPHVASGVWQPLLERGLPVRGLDAKDAVGVDYVCDISKAGPKAQEEIAGRFDLVLCNNTLVHVENVARALAALAGLVTDGGHLVVTTPRAYRPTFDPIDNGYRPRPDELVASLQALRDGMVVRRSELVRIDERGHYGRSVRPLSRVGRRRFPLPGAVEQLRYVIRPLRWRETCVWLST